MPRLVEGSEVSAVLSPEYAQRWGMAKDVVVAGGAGDNAAGAIGLGAIAPGDAFLSLGTSGVLFRVTDRFAPAPASAVHAFCHALPGLWHQMGVMLSAAASLAWLSECDGDARRRRCWRRSASASQDPSPIKFLPYLDGERTPHNDATAKRRVRGLARPPAGAATVRAGRARRRRLCRARQSRRARARRHRPITEVDLVGGGSRSPLWAQICADVLGIPVHRVEEGEVGAALGAARLGRLAATGENASAGLYPPAAARDLHAARLRQWPPMTKPITSGENYIPR